MRDARERTLHMLEAIERIEKYAVRGEQAFRADELIQNWMLRHIQVLGEAARALPPEFRDRYPDIPWTYIIGMRHVLVHEYFGIDLDIVWRVVSEDMPILKAKLRVVLADLA
jgi:uncharacterized protein with HEPN domain